MAKKMKPIGVGVVGLGRAGNGMHRRAMNMRPDKFKVVAACDVIKARTDAWNKEFDCPGYQSYDELLKNPNVELVDIATPSPDHVPMALKALKAGKKVFLEKPIALTFQEAKKLMKGAKGKEKNLFIRHNRRFEPGFMHIQEIIKEGLLGDVYEIKLRRHNYHRRADWQTIIDCGGGQLLNWGPHIVDHALRFLGGKVDSVWSDLRKIAAVGDAEDHVHIILKGGGKKSCVVDLEISGGVALGEPTYMVYGTKGSLIEKDGKFIMKYLDPKKKLAKARASRKTPGTESGFGAAEKLKWIEKEIAINPKAGGDTNQIWDHLYASIRQRKAFPITLQEALQVMEVLTLARKGTPFKL